MNIDATTAWANQALTQANGSRINVHIFLEYIVVNVIKRPKTGTKSKNYVQN